MTPTARRATIFAAVALLVAAAVVGVLLLDPWAAPETGGEAATDRPHTVVLVVLDTVRRDRVQPCGEIRPTSPALAKLAQAGTTYCDVVTPGSWTVPNHGAMFTGELPTVHQGDFAPSLESPNLGSLYVSRMRDDIPTLAERFSEAGYRTVLVSGNPFVRQESGLARGFDVVSVTRGFLVGEGGLTTPKVVAALDEHVQPDEPLFLVANLAAAHQPYEQVPEGVEWVDSTPGILNVFQGGLFTQFVKGELPEEATEALLRDARNGYDWGVRLADDDLTNLMGVLADRGRLDGTPLIAVTSDHGEMLGEHGLLDHGRTVARPNIDTFAIVAGPGFEAGAREDALVQSQDLYPTLLRAAGIEAPTPEQAIPLQRPDPDRMAVTVSQIDPHWTEITDGVVGDNRFAAVRRGSVRVVVREPEELVRGERLLEDGTTEQAPVDPELESVARALLQDVREMGGEGMEVSPETQEALRALGYTQ